MREFRADTGSGLGAATQLPDALNVVAGVASCRLAVPTERDADTVHSSPAAVVFVPGGVLFDDTLWRRWLLGLLNRLGWRLEYAQFCESLDREYLAKSCRGECSCDEAVVDFLRGLGLSRGQVDEIASAGRSRRAHFDSTLRPLSGSLPMLASLSAVNLPLAVLADSPLSSAELAQKLAGLGVEQYFDTIISSRDLGSTLPEAVNYQAVCQSLGLSPERVVFVGSRNCDLAGAKQFGMRTIACNYNADTEADQFADSLAQVANLIEPASVRIREVGHDRAAA